MTQTQIPLESSLQGKKLLDQMSDQIRLKQYSSRTEKTYISWVRHYILFHKKRHPKDMGADEIKQFLTHLVSDKKIAASTQNQALSAVLFLYRHVLKMDLDETTLELLRPQKSATVPVVMSKAEAKLLISKMTGVHQLIAQMTPALHPQRGASVYGSGLRIMEVMRLRVKDIDFDNRQVIVRDGKGGNDRPTMLPESLIKPLQAHLKQVKLIHEGDLLAGFGSVYLPYVLEPKYPNAHKEWIWQYVFPASSRFKDPKTGITGRHHLHETAVQKAVKAAAQLAKIDKRISPHTFRQCEAYL